MIRRLLLAILTIIISAPLWAQIGTASLSWQHNGLNVDGSTATLYEFRIYHSTISSVGPYQYIDRVDAAVLGYTDGGLYNGEHFWTVTAVDIALNESAMSNFASKVIATGGNDAPFPNAPTNLVAQ